MFRLFVQTVTILLTPTVLHQQRGGGGGEVVVGGGLCVLKGFYVEEQSVLPKKSERFKQQALIVE